MTFPMKYKDSDFLDRMDAEVPMTTTVVARRVGCSRNSAIAYLNRLLEAGKVKKVEIDGGFHAWILVDTDVNSETEPKYEPTLLELVGEYSRKHPDDALAKKMFDALQKKLNPPIQRGRLCCAN